MIMILFSFLKPDRKFFIFNC